MLKSVESIDEILESVQNEGSINKKLFISQNEVYPAGFTLGDEDSAGTNLKMEIVLLVERDSDSLHYKQEFQDEEQYQEVLIKINQLKKAVPYENINKEEMEKKEETT